MNQSQYFEQLHNPNEKNHTFSDEDVHFKKKKNKLVHV